MHLYLIGPTFLHHDQPTVGGKIEQVSELIDGVNHVLERIGGELLLRAVIFQESLASGSKPAFSTKEIKMVEVIASLRLVPEGCECHGNNECAHQYPVHACF